MFSLVVFNDGELDLDVVNDVANLPHFIFEFCTEVAELGVELYYSVVVL